MGYTNKNINIKDLEVNRGQITGLPKNPRFIRDERFEALKKSIEDAPEMLSLRELLVYPHEGKYIVIGGNMRLRACMDLGYKEVPCKVLDENTPVAKLREYSIKDNEAFGQNDWDILANEWDTDELTKWGMETPADWGMQTQTDDDGQNEVEEDDFDEEQDEIHVRCKMGDVWQLGEHRLMCGDSVDLEQVKKLMGGVNANMVFTDPPYNVAIGDKNAELQKFGKCGRITDNIKNDCFKTDEECGEKLWYPAFKNMLDASNDNCSIYVTMPQGGTHMMMMMMMHKAGWQVKHELIWVKSSPTFSMGRLDYDYQHEPICFGWKKTHKKIGKGKFNKSVWEIEKPKKSELHPTMKPIALIENALLNSSEENDIVLDLFGGSGSTLIACEQLNRKARLMELDPHYCDVIIARWEKLTGKTAEKIE